MVIRNFDDFSNSRKCKQHNEWWRHKNRTRPHGSCIKTYSFILESANLRRETQGIKKIAFTIALKRILEQQVVNQDLGQTVTGFLWRRIRRYGETSEEKVCIKGIWASKSNVYFTQGLEIRCIMFSTGNPTILDVHGKNNQVSCLVDLCAKRSYVCEDFLQKLLLKRATERINGYGTNFQDNRNVSITSSFWIKYQFQRKTTNPVLLE